jgi:hypothetical protein
MLNSGILSNQHQTDMNRRTLLFMFFNLLLMFVLAIVTACEKTEPAVSKPFVALKTGEFTADGTEVPVGGKLTFGITATEGSAPLTNIVIRRVADGIVSTELDQGIYLPSGGLDYTFRATKSAAQREEWHFKVMNARRDTATLSITVHLGEGSAYAPINHYPSLIIGMQHNTGLPQYVDLRTGNVFTTETVGGNEASVDMVAFVYFTGGVMSPTLCCPAYSGSSSVTGHYPDIAGWPVRNSTLYDYYTSDNDLIDPADFEAAINDSLLVQAYKPGNVSGLCKFMFTGRIVPFKTSDGKYGLIRVKHADTASEGFMEIEIKVQQ